MREQLKSLILKLSPNGTCCRCENPATGIGAGKAYCHKHFWQAFDEQEDYDYDPDKRWVF